MHLRALVGQRSQTPVTLGVVVQDAIPFSMALVLQRALLEASAAEGLWGLAWSVGVSCNRARSLWFAALALDDLLTWGLAPVCWTLPLPPSSHLAPTLSLQFFACWKSQSFLLCFSERLRRTHPGRYPSFRLPLHWISPRAPGQLQRSEARELACCSFLTLSP